MIPPSTQPVVVCADKLRDQYPTGRKMLHMTLRAFLLCGPFFLLATLLKTPWLGVIGIALAAIFIVIPFNRRIHRFIASLPCAACGLPAGRFTTIKGILHLECVHCGHLTRTDCLMLSQGQPTKV